MILEAFLLKQSVGSLIDFSRRSTSVDLYTAMNACGLLMEVFHDFDTESKLQSMDDWLSHLSLEGKRSITFGTLMCMRDEVGLTKVKSNTFWKTLKLIENGTDLHAGMERIRRTNGR